MGTHGAYHRARGSHCTRRARRCTILSREPPPTAASTAAHGTSAPGQPFRAQVVADLGGVLIFFGADAIERPSELAGHEAGDVSGHPGAAVPIFPPDARAAREHVV